MKSINVNYKNSFILHCLYHKRDKGRQQALKRLSRCLQF
jgi:hypothetical protein